MCVCVAFFFLQMNNGKEGKKERKKVETKGGYDF